MSFCVTRFEPREGSEGYLAGRHDWLSGRRKAVMVAEKALVRDGVVLTALADQTGWQVDWEQRGIVPDAEITLDWDEFSVENDPQLDAALDWLLRSSPGETASSETGH